MIFTKNIKNKNIRFLQTNTKIFDIIYIEKSGDMKEYLKVSKKLAKKQIIESIELEIIYEFIILKSKEMIITKIDTI